MEGIKKMQNTEIERAVSGWAPLSKTIFVPHSEEEYARIVAFLDHLTDEVGENEDHPLASLMELLSVVIEHYESAHVPELTEG